jgi:hypothetical protein
MRAGVTPLVALVLLSAPRSSTLAAQERVQVKQVDCPECRIRLTRVAVIAGKEPYTPHRTASVVKTRDGYACAPLDVPYVIGVFDAQGRFLKTVGAAGGGPGEFAFISGLSVGLADTLLVQDAGNGRISILGPSYNFVRTLPITGFIKDIRQLSATEYVARARISAFRQPLHKIDSEGVVTQSFGPSSRFSGLSAEDRQIAVAPNGRIYAVRMRRYEIEEYDTSGKLIRILERRTHWFGNRVGPGATIWDFDVLPDGKLALVIEVPRSNLPMPRKRNAAKPHSGFLGTDELLSQSTYLIELIDPETATLVASAKSPLFLGSFAGPAEITTIKTDSLGVARFEVWRVATVSPQERR